jgi:hypothetical protein
MGMYKSVYIGPYIKARLEDAEEQAPRWWYQRTSECGDEELNSGEVYIPEDKEREYVGGVNLGDESGVFPLPPTKLSESLLDALTKFRKTDPTASLHYGVIVSWG